MGRKKLEAKYGVYYQLRAMSDRICKEHGLSVVKNPQKHKTARSVYFAEKNGEPTRFNPMREALDKAMTIASSWNELSTVLRKMGYVFLKADLITSTRRSVPSAQRKVYAPSGLVMSTVRNVSRTG